MSVPPFKQYFPTEAHLVSQEQRAFYASLASRLDRGEFLDVDGNISYVYIYLYGLIERLQRQALTDLSHHLVRVSELYAHEDHLKRYCIEWASDCLLWQDRYDEYLQMTEGGGEAWKRLNVERWMGLPADSIDVYGITSGTRSSKFIHQHQGVYREALRELLDAFSVEHGGWLNLLIPPGLPEETRPCDLFVTTPGWVEYRRPLTLFDRPDVSAQIVRISRDAEDRARKLLGLPGIGEGWIAETELYRRVEAEFSETTVVQHGRPEWLRPQHFDVWLPHWGIALEYQGPQHFGPVEFFGGAQGYRETAKRDRRKASLAKHHGAVLLEVTADDDLDEVLRRVREIRAGQLEQAYGDA